MNWETLSSEYLTTHPPYFVSRKDVCKKADGILVPAYYVVELPPSVIVFALLDKEKVLMVEQYRHPVREMSLELPGGFVNENEELIDAAKREMLEETGYIFDDYLYLGKIAANPGVLNNFTHIFIAKNIAEKRSQQLDGSEEIALKTYTFKELAEIIKEHKIIQSLHVNACFYALLHLGKLNFD